MPIFYAEALLDHGAYLRRSGRPRLAREPIARALELSEAASAERLARLARPELAAAGGRRRRRASDSRELTAQEQRVASCAAEGMSNAQIAAALQLSSKTVGHHLQHIYAKLDIHSRRELIRRADPPA
jgi:DNA-binding NarL/FixJ family response regulator